MFFIACRLSETIGQEHGRLFWAMGLTLPLIYLTLTLLRGLLIAAFTPLIRRLSGSEVDLSWQVRGCMPSFRLGGDDVPL